MSTWMMTLDTGEWILFHLQGDDAPAEVRGIVLGLVAALLRPTQKGISKLFLSLGNGWLIA